MSYLKNWPNWGLLWIPLQEENFFSYAQRRGFNRNRCVFALTASKLNFDTTECVTVIWNHRALLKMKHSVVLWENPRHSDTRRNHFLPVSTQVAGKRVGHLSNRFLLFFTEPAFHLLPQPLLRSSEEHQYGSWKCQCSSIKEKNCLLSPVYWSC